MKFLSILWPVRALLVVPVSLLAAGETRTSVHGVDPSYMKPNASPCVDFYTYANGAFDATAIPGEYAAYGVNQEIDERNFSLLKEILETAAKTTAAKGTVAQRVGDFYASGMDEATIEKTKLAPLQPLFAKIAGIKAPADLVPLLAQLQLQGVGAGFNFGVQVDDKNSAAMIAGFAQGGLGLPERDYYTREGKESEEIRAAYVQHVGRMLELAGDGAGAAHTSAAAIMSFETKLAKASRTLVERRDPEKNYHKFERTALAKMAPGFGWDEFFSTIRFPAGEKTVLVGQPEFFTALGELMRTEPLETWRVYLRWHVLRTTANFLSRDFVEERFAFYGKKLSGTTELRPRWKRVLAAADHAIGEDLGQLYVQKAFSPASKARALEMVKFHKAAMRAHLQAADWMTESTKKAAYKKLDTMNTKVGYPDKWRDYSKLEIARRPYVLNFLAANAFDAQRDLNKLGKPVDRNEWFMTPQTNNAYYDPSLNEMCFPAGILQPPFFDELADDASNYGALASTIGHELTHGFDDQGRQYDAEGNLKNWWTDEDVKRFEERAELVAKQYDAFEVLPGLHINGHQTLGENIADVGGLRISYDAFKLATKGKTLPPIDGLTSDQRFFIAFAQGWRTNERPENVRLHVTSDVHSPVRWRVLGPVENFPAFRAAFNCQESTPSWAPIWE